jgi:hypothetical protein
MADSVLSFILVPLFATIALWFTVHAERGLTGELLEEPAELPSSSAEPAL